MAQAATANTDELISQLASSEIDRLLAEADGNPAPMEAAPAEPASNSTSPEGPERAALLQAAGFETAPAPASAAAVPPPEDERSALLNAAGFESPVELHFEKPGAGAVADADSAPVPIYLKPLVWINLPVDFAPAIVRQMLGKVGIVTMFNALVVLTYVLFFRKH
jgi:hypothetical protein